MRRIGTKTREPSIFSLVEVLALGFEAYHCGEDGVWWLFHGAAAMRSDPATGQRTLVFDPGQLPRGPWHPTHWGERELRALEDDAS